MRKLYEIWMTRIILGDWISFNHRTRVIQSLKQLHHNRKLKFTMIAIHNFSSMKWDTLEKILGQMKEQNCIEETKHVDFSWETNYCRMPKMSSSL